MPHALNPRMTGTFGSVYRVYRMKPEIGYSDMPLLRRLRTSLVARRKLRHVRHVTFDQLSSAGYDVQTIDDGAVSLEPEKIARRDLPESWKIPQPVITPKIATLRDATLFGDGSALLADERHLCYFDTAYTWGTNWGRPRAIDARTHIFFHERATDSALIRRHTRCIGVPGRCFSARLFHRRNFCLFVNCVLTRIYYEDLGAIIPGRDKIIAPPFFFPMEETLFRKIFEGYEIVQVPPFAALRVEELLLPANLVKTSSFNPAAIASLAKRLGRIMAPHAANEKHKVCVSRKDSARNNIYGRNFANEEAYEALMRKLNYRILNISEIDSAAQFALWANTTDIVGVHGAGMINMIMMPTGGNYTEIAGATNCKNSISRLAMATGHLVCGLITALDTEGHPVIDLDRLAAQLLDAS